jgi:peptidoglycan/xylan/chitin deacetylase (PgdA/CDA1 family)
MKQLLLTLLYRAGALSAWRRWRHGHSLTVLIFHRVLPFDTARPSSQWPGYTVTPDFLRQCLNFLRRHYELVSLDQVLTALRGGAGLPPTALLITIDDGWKDTSEYAEPLLRQAGCPAVLFAVGGLCDGLDLWQESLYHALLAGELTPSRCLMLWREVASPEPPPTDWSTIASIWKLAARLQSLDNAHRRECLTRAGLPPPAPSPMMPVDELRGFARPPLSVGAHGYTHLPMTEVPDAAGELRLSRSRLRQALAGLSEVETMSWPHGRYSPELTTQAWEAGFECQFTSDQIVNHAPSGRPARLLGRYELAMGDLANASGNLRPEKLANALFRLPRAILGETE